MLHTVISSQFGFEIHQEGFCDIEAEEIGQFFVLFVYYIYLGIIYIIKIYWNVDNNVNIYIFYTTNSNY